MRKARIIHISKVQFQPTNQSGHVWILKSVWEGVDGKLSMSKSAIISDTESPENTVGRLVYESSSNGRFDWNARDRTCVRAEVFCGLRYEILKLEGHQSLGELPTNEVKLVR